MSQFSPWRSDVISVKFERDLFNSTNLHAEAQHPRLSNRTSTGDVEARAMIKLCDCVNWKNTNTGIEVDGEKNKTKEKKKKKKNKQKKTAKTKQTKKTKKQQQQQGDVEARAMIKLCVHLEKTPT